MGFHPINLLKAAGNAIVDEGRALANDQWYPGAKKGYLNGGTDAPPSWLEFVAPLTPIRNIIQGQGSGMDYGVSAMSLLPFGAALKGLSKAGQLGGELAFGSGGANAFARMDKSFPSSVYDATKRYSRNRTGMRVDHLLDEPIHEMDTNKLSLAMDLVRAQDMKPVGTGLEGRGAEQASLAGIPDKLRQDYAQEARAFILQRKHDGMAPTVRDVRDELQRQWDAERASWDTTTSLKSHVNADGDLVQQEIRSPNTGRGFDINWNKKGSNFLYRTPEQGAVGKLTKSNVPLLQRLLDVNKNYGRSIVDVTDSFNGQVQSRSWEGWHNHNGEWMPGLREYRLGRSDKISSVGGREAGINSPSIATEKLGEKTDHVFAGDKYTLTPADRFSYEDALASSKEFENELWPGTNLQRPDEYRVSLYAEKLINDPAWVAKYSKDGKATPGLYELARRDAETHLQAAFDRPGQSQLGKRELIREELKRLSRLEADKQAYIYGYVGPRSPAVDAGVIDQVARIAAGKKDKGYLRLLGGIDKSGMYDHAAVAASHAAEGRTQLITPWGVTENNASQMIPHGMRVGDLTHPGVPYQPKELLKWLEGSVLTTRATKDGFTGGIQKVYPEGDHLRRLLTIALGPQGYNDAVSTLRTAIKEGDQEKVKSIRSMIQWGAQQASMLSGKSGKTPISGLLVRDPGSIGSAGNHLLSLARDLKVPTFKLGAEGYPEDWTPDLISRWEKYQSVVNGPVPPEIAAFRKDMAWKKFRSSRNEIARKFKTVEWDKPQELVPNAPSAHLPSPSWADRAMPRALSDSETRQQWYQNLWDANHQGPSKYAEAGPTQPGYTPSAAESVPVSTQGFLQGGRVSMSIQAKRVSDALGDLPVTGGIGKRTLNDALKAIQELSPAQQLMVRSYIKNGASQTEVMRFIKNLKDINK